MRGLIDVCILIRATDPGVLEWLYDAAQARRCELKTAIEICPVALLRYHPLIRVSHSGFYKHAPMATRVLILSAAARFSLVY